MTENKLTEAEIMKALECCVSEQYTCEQCPYQEIKHYDYDNGFEIMPNGKQYDDWSCERWLNTDILALINRKNDQIKHKDDEIDLLQKAIQVQEAMLKNQDYAIKTARAEAIKEFAERVQKLVDMCWYDLGNFDDLMEMKTDIDKIAKEMGVEL
jgi:hypothetical protein